MGRRLSFRSCPTLVRGIRSFCACLPLLVSGRQAFGQRDSAVRALPVSAVQATARNSRLASHRATSTGLAVLAGGRRYAVSLDGRVGSWRIDSVVTLAAAARSDTFYVLADVSGRSSAGPDGGGYCGAGREGDLVWLKLARGRTKEVRTAPYQSCLSSLNSENEEPYARNADSIWFEGTRLRGHRAVRIRYLVTEPVRGMESLVDTLAADSLPRYPLPMAQANIEGDVTLRVIRSPRRWSDSVVVLASSHRLFTEAVTTAVSQWAIAGVTDTGTRVVTVRFVFALRRDDVCNSSPPRVPGRIPTPLGTRARLEPAPAGEVRGRIEVCPIATHVHEFGVSGR